MKKHFFAQHFFLTLIKYFKLGLEKFSKLLKTFFCLESFSGYLRQLFVGLRKSVQQNMLNLNLGNPEILFLFGQGDDLLA